MINGGPLNSYPLNGLSGASSTQPTSPGTEPGTGGGNNPDPVIVVPDLSFKWDLVVRINGQDFSERLRGTATIDREEGASGLATVAIQMEPGPVVPTDWIGRAIEIDFISEVKGKVTQTRRYTGQISDPSYDPTSRVMTFQCTDQLQKRVEAMAIAEIDALVGGYWSADVFQPTEGRSRWDYAIERLNTRPVSLDASPAGELRVTPWLAAETPAYTFGEGSTIYQGITVELAQLDSLTNVVEIEGGYRYARLWQQNNTYYWKHAGTEPFSGGQGFCEWRRNSTELPTKDMLESAVSGSGQTLLGASYYILPPSHPDPCGTGSPWINYYTDLFLEVSFSAARRWVQQMRDQYTIRITAPASIAQAGEQITRDSLALEVVDERAETWEEEPITGGENGFTDLGNVQRRDEAMRVLVQQASTSIYRTHRDTTVRWTEPTSMVLGVDLVHTLRVEDQGIKAQGKCRRIEDEFDLEEGSAITTLSIAIMRGGGTATGELSLPPVAVPSITDTGAKSFVLATQLGGQTSQPYNEEIDGFIGNYTAIYAGTETYPRQFKITAPEVSETLRDEHISDVAATIEVGIPNDLLEL